MFESELSGMGLTVDSVLSPEYLTNLYRQTKEKIESEKRKPTLKEKLFFKLVENKVGKKNL